MAVSTNLFHFNITIIYSIFMLHWFELFISRLFIFPYQEGFLPVTLATRSSESLLQYTFDDTLEYVSSMDALFPLVLGAGLRVRYLLIVCFALPCVAVERFFATWLMSDYEHKTRGQISAVSIIIVEIFATCGAFAVSYQWISVFETALCAALLTLFSYFVSYHLCLSILSVSLDLPDD